MGVRLYPHGDMSCGNDYIYSGDSLREMVCMKRLTVCILLLILSISLSCARQTSFPAVGSYSQIVLVTETGKVEGYTKEMVRQLQHVIDYYNREELQFFVKVVSVDEFEKEAPPKNVVFLGLPRQGRVGDYIERLIGSAGVKGVLEGRLNIFKKLNYPIEGQLTLVVTASSPEYLSRIIEKNGAFIRDLIEQANRERLRNYLLKEERKWDSDRLKAKYGFRIRIPKLYRINQEREDVPGIEIVRIKPHRGLTISWRSWKKEELSLADSTELYDIRSQLAWKMYDKDVMRKELVRYSMTKLGDYDAVRMDGYWENTQDVYGGPFVCFFINDRVKNKLWIVDCVVFAPGFKKHKLLRELIALAETFEI